MTRLVALGALLAALSAATLSPVAAAPAPAPEPARAGTGLGVSSASLDVVMTNDGAAHVAYLTRVDLTVAAVVHVCRIPAGGVSCTETASLTLPNLDDTLGPWIVSDGTKVVVAVGNHNGAQERTYAAASANGSSFGALSAVANITPTDVELSPAADKLWITAASGPMNGAFDYLAFASAPLPGGSTTAAAVFTATPGNINDGGQLLGISPDGKPVGFVVGSSRDFPAGSYYRAFAGTPTNNPELVDTSKWGPLTNYDLASPAQRNGDYDVASGYSRMWVGYEGLQRDTVLRPFAGGGFGAPVSPDCVSSRFTSGTQDAPDIAISRTGDLLVTETGSNGGGQMYLGFFHGTSDGSKFSAYTELAAAPGIRDVETAADPTSDAGGIAVWTADAIYGGPLSFTRLPAVAATGCPPPTPPPGASSTVSGKISGATVELTVPSACVSAGKKFTVKVAKKKGTGTVVKVIFKASTAKKVVDTKGAFKAKLTVKKGTPSGTTIKVKAKITVAPPKGKLVTKSLKTSFAVC